MQTATKDRAGLYCIAVMQCRGALEQDIFFSIYFFEELMFCFIDELDLSYNYNKMLYY
jgi:hypothetical protein